MFGWNYLVYEGQWPHAYRFLEQLCVTENLVGRLVGQTANRRTPEGGGGLEGRGYRAPARSVTWKLLLGTWLVFAFAVWEVESQNSDLEHGADPSSFHLVLRD